MKQAAAATFAVLLAGAAAYAYFSHERASNALAVRIGSTFSDTQTWDATLLPYLPQNLTNADARDRARSYIASITIDAPPPATSSTTISDLATLHELADARIEDVLAEIEAEVHIDGFRLGEFALRGTARPLTRALLLDAKAEVLPVILAFKERFDRVRPSLLDPTLTTAIPVPGHPAYPSGHATEAHVYAHILSILDPANKDAYFNDAARIARNREIAGVHYPSDSAAGASLASQFIDLYFKTDAARTLLQAARTEWE